MSRSRTGKRVAAGGQFAAVFAGLLGLATSAHADGDFASDLRVLVSPTSNTSLSLSRQILLSGKAPLRCAPLVEHVALDGTDLAIRLKAPAANCDAKRSAPFSLRVNPAGTDLSLIAGQVYRVRIYAGSDAGAPLLAFRLLDTADAASAPTPENGFWWSEASAETGAAVAGSGASIEAQNGQLAISLLGFADTGAATWYFGSAPQNGRVAHVDMVELANGDSTFSPIGNQPSAQAGPRLEVEFLSPTRARVYAVRSEGGRDVDVRTLTLSRSRFAQGPLASTWSGQWIYIPDDNGAPRVFDFADASSQGADTFHLADVQNDAALDCRLAAGTQHPDVCTLTHASMPLADFDQVGMDRLSGRGSDGSRVKLMRVPR